MKKIATVILAAAMATSAYAACSTHTYYVNGKMVICTTCCVGEGPSRSCTTTCN